MTKFIDHITALISKGQLEMLFKLKVKKRLPEAFRKAFNSLSCRYYSLKHDFAKGLITYEQFDAFRNRIVDSLLLAIANIVTQNQRSESIVAEKKMLNF